MDLKMSLDIRMLKFQDYIRRKPDRPFGYYGLGIQYMLAGKPGLADKMFTQALKKNPGYVPAKSGKLEVLLAEERYVAAARYYQKNRESFERKRIYAKRVHRTVSRIYLLRSFSVHLEKLRSIFAFDEKIGALQKMYNANAKNPVVNILLSMYFLKKEKDDDRAFALYNLCVGLDGICDRLRWDLVNILSKKQPAILRDTKIADLFQSIPENLYKVDYVNFLLTCFMAQHDMEKVMNAFSNVNERQLVPSRRTMWEFLYFCSSRDVWNSTAASYCQKLIENGWVNSFLSQTAIRLKNKGFISSNNKIFSILSLYGYNEA